MSYFYWRANSTWFIKSLFSFSMTARICSSSVHINLAYDIYMFTSTSILISFSISYILNSRSCFSISDCSASCYIALRFCCCYLCISWISSPLIFMLFWIMEFPSWISWKSYWTKDPKLFYYKTWIWSSCSPFSKIDL